VASHTASCHVVVGPRLSPNQGRKATPSKAEPGQQQDWFLKCLQVGEPILSRPVGRRRSAGLHRCTLATESWAFGKVAGSICFQTLGGPHRISRRANTPRCGSINHSDTGRLRDPLVLGGVELAVVRAVDELSLHQSLDMLPPHLGHTCESRASRH
jgi:hypothetical protein